MKLVSTTRSHNGPGTSGNPILTQYAFFKNRENGEMETKNEAKKRVKEAQKERLKKEKEQARLAKEQAEKAAKEAADVVSLHSIIHFPSLYVC